MKEHNKTYYSLEELKRARDCYEGYQDGEEVYYFVGALRYACDEIERLNKENSDLQNIANIETSKNEYLEKENERLNNIIDKINRLFDVDTHCENIYHAIGVLLNKPYFEIEMIDNEEILDILGVDKE